jgi:electron transfer flavoprotein beta subunit
MTDFRGFPSWHRPIHACGPGRLGRPTPVGEEAPISRRSRVSRVQPLTYGRLVGSDSPPRVPTIAVFGKFVPVGGQFLRVDGVSLTRTGVTHGLDPVNEVGLEWALRAREAGLAERVVVVTMGPPDAADGLRHAHAMGADEVVLVTDPQLAGADVRVTAAALAACTTWLSADIAVFGYESLDGSSGTVPSAVATALGRPLISRARDAALRGGRLQAERDLGTGAELVDAPLPVVVSFVEGSVVPRYPKLRDVLAARRVEVTTVSTADLGVQLPSPRPGNVIDLVSVLTTRGEARVVDGPTGVAELARILTEAGAVGA